MLSSRFSSDLGSRLTADAWPGEPAGVARRELVELGVITRPHGVRGEVRVHLYNPASTLFFECQSLYLLHESRPIHRVEVESVRLGRKMCRSWRSRKVTDRTSAERLRGATFAAHESDLPKLDPGEWYHRDLVGMAVVGPSGQRVGVVEAVLPYPTVDSLQVRGDEGVLEVPMAEPWLVRVDVQEREVHVTGIDELELEK